MNTETQVAQRLAHQQRTNAILARTGGEIIHPDHYDFKMAFRDSVLAAMDASCNEHHMARVNDADLPELFVAIDALAERLVLRKLGL